MFKNKNIFTMKNKILVSVFMFAILFMNAQDVQEPQRQEPFKNTGIAIYPFGMSFLKSNQFKKSLQENGINVDIPKVFACMSLKVTPINFWDFGLFSVDVGMEGNYQKTKEHSARLFTVFGTIEYLYPIVNKEKTRLLTSVGTEYASTKFEYYTLANGSTSFQNLLATKDGGINLTQNISFSAFVGVYFNYFFFKNQGVSIFTKYRIPLDKNNANWKVANTDKTVTNLDKHISNYFLIGVGYVFAF